MPRFNALVSTLTLWALAISTPVYSVNEDLYHVNPTTCLRIEKLMPDDLAIDLPIDPAVPDNFVAMSPSGHLTSADDFYWGPQGVLEEYFQNPQSLKEPILRVRVGMARQSEFDERADERLSKQFAEMGLTEFKSRRYQWDDLPVYAIRAATSEMELHLCWVGINHPNEFTFNFELVFPECQKSPDEKDLQLWNTFLSQTRALRGLEVMQSAGFHMLPGYTIYDKTDVKIKVIAERRTADQLMQIIIVPLSQKTTVAVDRVTIPPHAPQLVGVYGCISSSGGRFNMVIDTSIPILFNEVAEFSIDPLQIKDPAIVWIQKDAKSI